jgi:hypothetical protein
MKYVRKIQNHYKVVAEAGITITPDIEKKLKEFSSEQKKEILKRAWDACCDGEWLGHYCKENRLSSDIDFWDGNHEDLRLSLEMDCLDYVLEDYD